MNTISKHISISIFAVLLLLSIGGFAQDQELNLMPVPAQVQLDSGKFFIDTSFAISLAGAYDPRLAKEASRFLRRLDRKTGLFFHQNKVNGQIQTAPFSIKVERPGRVELHEDESYKLNISEEKIELQAVTDIGAIRGLETLLQLLKAADGHYYFPEVAINDHPRFAWRGLMIDVARHFMPLEVLYRNLDGMAAVKLNVLHLHLADDQGFRFQSKAYPRLTQLASDGKYYTEQELTKLINYADQRGIRIVPEIDVPGHATAMLVAYPELGSKDTTYTLERYAGIFDPTLDPTNEKVYTFLETLFGEIAKVFPDPFFHIGGDENMGKHWDANSHIQDFMRAHQLKTNHELQTYFNIKLEKILEGLGKRTMGWEEIMSANMPRTAVIHSWRGAWEDVPAKKSLYDAAKAGYETILSNGYYLDMMQTSAEHYLVDPAPASVSLTDKQRENILGGEICMWSELVVPKTIDSRIWPRTAAIAERFWSPEDVKDVDDMYRRLNIISLQLEQLGLIHLTAKTTILRKLAKSKDIKPLETLVDVVEPMKGYTRNPGGTMYASYSPFTLWADAATPDARVARNFNDAVEQYLSGEQIAGQLSQQLTLWQHNDAKVKPIIDRSPVLAEISELSTHLAQIASIGLEAIAFLESDKVPKAEWFKTSKKSLEAAKENGGRTELQVISGIEMLVGEVEASAQ